MLFQVYVVQSTTIAETFIFYNQNRVRGEHVNMNRGTLSVIEAFQKKMEEIIAAEENEEQKKILKKALERGLLALEGEKQ